MARTIGLKESLRIGEETGAEAKELEKDLKSSDVKVQWDAIRKMKRLSSDIISLHEFGWNGSIFVAVIEFIKQQTYDFLRDEKHDAEMLQSALSILGNYCHQVKEAPYFVVDKFQTLPEALHHILSCDRCHDSLKVTILRLHANVSKNPEAAILITHNNGLNKFVASSISSVNADIRKQAFRAVKYLFAAGCARMMTTTDVGTRLGNTLADPTYGKDSIQLLLEMAKRVPEDLDKQMDASCAEEFILKDFFVMSEDGDMTPIQRLTMSLCSTGNMMREKLETGGMIERLFELENNKVQYLMLTTFSKTAWGRSKLRQTGALDLLIERLEKSECLKERRAIAASLRYFSHDSSGLSYLAESKTFITTVVKDVNDFVKKYYFQCVPDVVEEKSDRNPFRSRKRSSDDSHQKHIDYHGTWSFSSPKPNSSAVSPPQSPAFSRSPSYSPPMSPTRQENAAFEHELLRAQLLRAAPSHLDLYIRQQQAELRLELLAANSIQSSANDRQEERNSRSSKKARVDEYTDQKMEHQIVEAGLLVLTAQAQIDDAVQHLLREDVVICIINYLLHAPNPDYRCYRILKRLAAVRRWVASLLEMQFHVRILTDLCSPPCRMVKYARECKRCSRCMTFGREVVKEFASHVDNSYGHAILASRQNSANFVEKTSAVIANITLRKTNAVDIVGRTEVKFTQMVNQMLSLFEEMLESDMAFEEKGGIVSYPGGPSLASQVIGAVSTLITAKIIKDLTENDQLYQPPDEGFGDCNMISRESDLLDHKNVDFLTFVTPDGTFLAGVPMDAACLHSSYFEGMFNVSMTENITGQRRFVFDSMKELCSQAEFIQFLHHLAGCTSLCTAVTSGEECAILWQLSDRYLCTSILDKLYAPSGPIRSFLNGTTLPCLLPAALTAGAHHGLLDAAILTLIRYSTHEQVTTTLHELLKLPFIVPTFTAKLQETVAKFILGMKHTSCMSH